MFDFFEGIVDVLLRHDNQILIVAIYLIFCAVLVALRIVSHLHVMAVLSLVQRESLGEIKIRGEIPKIRNRMLRRVVAEYIRVAERAVTNVPTSHIVNRAVSGMNLLGWKYDSLVPFVSSLENAVLWIGLILALLFPGYAYVYGLLAIGVFVLLRLSGSLFGIDNARRQLGDEMVIFVEREIGRFFAADSGGAILRLKNDLTEALTKQGVQFKNAMENISAAMNSTMKEVSVSMIAAANSIGVTINTGLDENLKNINKDLRESFENWEKALEKGVLTQELINQSAERVSLAASKLKTSAELLSTHMQGHSSALSGQLLGLVDAINSLKDGYTHLAMHQDVLARQSEFIEKNQLAFENIAASYEASLKNLASQIGDGIGAFVSLHAEESAKTITNALNTNIDKLAALVDQKQVR